MRYIKFCKKEHNLKLGSPTIQFGTFQYYREMDPKFSIADASEGIITYKANVPNANPIVVSPEQLEGITAGAGVTFSSKGSANPHWPGSVRFSESDGITNILNEREIEWSGNLEIQYLYPNAYLFCMSVFEDGDKIPDPSTIDKEYDSYYEINESDIKNFEALLRNKLTQSLMYQDIEFSKLSNPAPITVPLQLVQVASRALPVSYVKSCEITLSSPEDFELNALTKRFTDIVFEKSEDYHTDEEYRIAFFMQHQSFGPLSAYKNPKIVEINPISRLLI